MAILFITRGVAITNAAAGTTITHGLSRTASRLWCQAHGLAVGGNSHSLVIGLSTITANTVILNAAEAGATADVLIEEIHSIQGGPTSQT